MGASLFTYKTVWLFWKNSFMPQQRYINIHTHHPLSSKHEDIFELVNLYDQFETASVENFCSMGLHPWYLQNIESQLDILHHHSGNANVLAIGECGLDKVCTTDWSVQQLAFQSQIELADKLNKPLIIHCVRAYSEVLSMLQKVNVPVIFHGFNKNLVLAMEIIHQGYYLSFGAALLKDNSTVHETFAQIPPDRFFLETDDAGISITEVYQAAAYIRKTEEEVIILQLQQNFKKVFGI
jgi:TatD DNase family protein